jgi:hypothetical protein
LLKVAAFSSTCLLVFSSNLRSHRGQVVPCLRDQRIPSDLCRKL